jgi:hypothetical protein
MLTKTFQHTSSYFPRFQNRPNRRIKQHSQLRPRLNPVCSVLYPRMRIGPAVTPHGRGEPAKILPYWIGNLILPPRFNLIRQGLTEPSVAPGVAALAEAQVPEAFATDFHHSSQHCYESGQSVRATDHFSVKWNALYRSGTLDEVRFTCSHATEMVNLHSSTSTLLDVSLIANDPCPSNLFNASRTPVGQVSLVRQSTDTIDLPFVTAANLFG